MDASTPTASLARWYRCKKRRLGDAVGREQATGDPRSILQHLLRTDPEALEHVKAQAQEFRCQLDMHLKNREPDLGELRVTTALFIEASGGSLEEVNELLAAAIDERETAEPDLVPGRWRAERARVNRLVEAERVRTASLADEAANGSLPPRFIPREDAATLSYPDFVEKYAIPGIPCIITGGALSVTGTDNSFVATGCEGAGAVHSDKPQKASPWSSFDTLAAALRGQRCTLKVFREGSSCWARLEDAPREEEKGSSSSVDAGEFVRGVGSGEEANREEGIDGAKSKTGELRYLHDWSLPLHAPELAHSLTIPKWFSHDLFVALNRCEHRPLTTPRLPVVASAAASSAGAVAPGVAAATAGGGGGGGGGTPYPHRYSRSWPSLFVGPRGSKSDLHVDAAGTHFWQAVVAGTKYWRVFPRDHMPFLYPEQFEGSRDVLFQVDAVALSSTGSDTSGTPGKRLKSSSAPPFVSSAFPAAAFAVPWEDTVDEGDLIFVPNDCPHFVQNLSDTVAVSANFVDPCSNAGRVLEALQEDSWSENDASSARLADSIAAELERFRARRAGRGGQFAGTGSEARRRHTISLEPEHIPYIAAVGDRSP